MIEARVSSNIDKVLAEFTIVSQGLANKAAVRALNRAANQAKTASKRNITAVYNVLARDAEKEMKVISAYPDRLSAILKVIGRRSIPVYEYKATWQRSWTGARFKIKKNGGARTIRHSFIQRVKAGTKSHVGVFVPSDKRLRNNDKKWGIVEKYTIGIPYMFASKAVQKAVKQVAVESFEKNFRQQVKYLTSGGR